MFWPQFAQSISCALVGTTKRDLSKINQSNSPLRLSSRILYSTAVEKQDSSISCNGATPSEILICFQSWDRYHRSSECRIFCGILEYAGYVLNFWTLVMFEVAPLMIWCDVGLTFNWSSAWAARAPASLSDTFVFVATHGVEYLLLIFENLVMRSAIYNYIK